MRDSLLERRQLGAVPFGLIQVIISHGRVVIAQRLAVVVGTAPAVLDREAERLLERHGVENVPAVARVQNAAPLAPFFGIVVIRHAMERVPESVLKIPGAAEIVLAPGSLDGWLA